MQRDVPSPFRGRRACVATKHGKEAALRPLLEEALGLRFEPPPAGFDSDRFGTFSGTVPRRSSAIDAARSKARMAAELGAPDLVIASEGSFSPHPDMPIATLGVELVLLTDPHARLEILGWSSSLHTNHASIAFVGPEEAVAFAHRMGFPSHGVLVTVGDPPLRVFEHAKRAVELQRQAVEALEHAARIGANCRVSSDMRAHRNPTRMKAIEAAGLDLARRALTLCPRCHRPGFGLDRHLPGLPCRDCGEPTQFVRVEIHACPTCRFEEERPRPDGLAAADPGACPACNP